MFWYTYIFSFRTQSSLTSEIWMVRVSCCWLVADCLANSFKRRNETHWMRLNKLERWIASKILTLFVSVISIHWPQLICVLTPKSLQFEYNRIHFDFSAFLCISLNSRWISIQERMDGARIPFLWNFLTNNLNCNSVGIKISTLIHHKWSSCCWKFWFDFEHLYDERANVWMDWRM